MLSPTRIAVLAVALALMPSVAAAQSPTIVGPYDGEIPFKCELQNVGTGTDFPEPHADPFCVEFDKTNQNVTDFGLVDFTAQEPARVAAAGEKCFYFQRDHWTGSVVQGQAPEVWNWDGNYFYDRARGVGGVSVRNFRVGGTPQSAGPFVPPGYEPYFDENGGGGVEVLLESDPDPSCASKVDTPEERDRVYGDRPAREMCIEPGGGIRGRKVGRVRIGNRRDAIRTKLGPPTYARKSMGVWCLVGKGELRVAYSKDGRVGGILTSGRGQAFRDIAHGTRLRRAHRTLDLAGIGRRGGDRLFVVRERGSRRILLGAHHGRIRWVALLGTDRITAKVLESLIRRVP